MSSFMEWYLTPMCFWRASMCFMRFMFAFDSAICCAVALSLKRTALNHSYIITMQHYVRQQRRNGHGALSANSNEMAGVQHLPVPEMLTRYCTYAIQRKDKALQKLEQQLLLKVLLCQYQLLSNWNILHRYCWMMHLFHVPCRFLQQYYGNSIDNYQVRTITHHTESSKTNKLARHSINYKEESWKGVRLNWDT